MGRKNRTGKGRARAAMQTTPAAREQAARLYNRGVQLEQAGEPAQAEGAYRQALALDPGLAQAHNNLGNVLKERGKWKPAEKCYRQALALAPGNPLLLSNIGNALLHQDKPSDALTLLHEALASDPDHALAHNNLASTLAALDRDEEALEHFHKAHELAPRDGEIACNLADALYKREAYAESVAVLRRAEGANPAMRDIQLLLGDALLGQDNPTDAIAAYEAALALQADDRVHAKVANGYLEAGRPLEARAAAQKAIALNPDDAGNQRQLGLVLISLHQLASAERALRKAIALQPGAALNHMELGLLLRSSQRHREAGTAFAAALRLEPDNTAAFRLLAIQAKHTRLTLPVETMEERLDDPGLTAGQRIDLHLGLGYAYESLGEFRQAFAHLAQGKQLRLKRLPYDPAPQAKLVEALIGQFDAHTLARFTAKEPLAEAPIFIVGLPRAGKTLLASALGRHSTATSVDESQEFENALDEVLRAHGRLAYPKDMGKLDDALLAEIGAAFMEREQRKSASAGRHVSNGVGYDRYVGMLRLCLPGARIVHCTRGLRDNCTEIYRKEFRASYHGYSDDVRTTVARYRLHHCLMAHWKALLPGAIHTLAFEDLVRDPEAELRKVAAFCDLPWEAACAAGPWPTEKGAVGTWRRYAAELGPLFDELGAE